MTLEPGPRIPTRSRRTTRPCDAVEDELARSERFRDAQEIHTALRDRGAQVGLATVYRTLQALVDSGLADVLRLDSGTAAYRLCSPTRHHHLVCRLCGTAVEVQIPTIARWAERTADEHGFTELAYAVELWGVCGPCRAGRTNA